MKIGGHNVSIFRVKEPSVRVAEINCLYLFFHGEEMHILNLHVVRNILQKELKCLTLFCEDIQLPENGESGRTLTKKGEMLQ